MINAEYILVPLLTLSIVDLLFIVMINTLKQFWACTHSHREHNRIVNVDLGFHNRALMSD